MARAELLLCILLGTLTLGACVVSGPSLDSMVDTELTTGSVTKAAALPPQPTPEQVSDERTVRNAISAARLDGAAPANLAWSNTDTGASGTITAIEEMREGDSLCRSFQTSRQRFDGVALYHGKACTQGAGEWTLVSFQENG